MGDNLKLIQQIRNKIIAITNGGDKNDSGTD